MELAIDPSAHGNAVPAPRFVCPLFPACPSRCQSTPSGHRILTRRQATCIRRHTRQSSRWKDSNTLKHHASSSLEPSLCNSSTARIGTRGFRNVGSLPRLRRLKSVLLKRTQDRRNFQGRPSSRSRAPLAAVVNCSCLSSDQIPPKERERGQVSLSRRGVFLGAAFSLALQSAQPGSSWAAEASGQRCACGGCLVPWPAHTGVPPSLTKLSCLLDSKRDHGGRDRSFREDHTEECAPISTRPVDARPPAPYEQLCLSSTLPSSPQARLPPFSASPSTTLGRTTSHRAAAAQTALLSMRSGGASEIALSVHPAPQQKVRLTSLPVILTMSFRPLLRSSRGQRASV